MVEPPLQPPADLEGEWIREPQRLAGLSVASGVLRAQPAAAAVPRHADDVARLVRWAADSGAALVPRAAGTGMPGGNIGPGVVVDLMRHFRSVEPPRADARRIRAQPGATRAEVNAACAAHGLHLPVDPSSGERCSIGGMIANNSAGAHSVLHGAMRGWVESLDLVLADGTRCSIRRGERPQDGPLARILEVVDRLLRGREAEIERRWPRVRKNSSGYALREYLATGDAVDLLVGSEGTLALVVDAELRLALVPAHRGLAVLEFDTLEAAGRAVEVILRHRPATCEMLDRTFLELVRTAEEDPGYPLRPGIEALLFVEIEADAETELRERLSALEAAVAGLASRATLTLEPATQRRFWQVRHAASPIISRRADGRVSMQFIEDGVVPVPRLPEYVRALREILHSHDTPAVIFGHAGDGNLHVNPLVDVRAPRWRESVESILAETAAAVASLGGTLAGEHGDGRLRAPLLETIWGPELVSLFRGVKDAFDPRGVLNPGVILPLPGQRPLDAFPADPPASKPEFIPT